jgi:hypothetical protein
VFSNLLHHEVLVNDAAKWPPPLGRDVAPLIWLSLPPKWSVKVSWGSAKGEEPLTVNTGGQYGVGKVHRGWTGESEDTIRQIFALLYILTDNDSLPRDVYRVYANQIPVSILVCVRHPVPNTTNT